MLDFRTILFSYVISNALCAIVIGMLWRQSRRRFEGLDLWFADFVMHFVALLLVALRGFIPDFISIVVSNGLVIGGTLLLNVGLERFIGRPGPQKHNLVILAAFLAAQWYFTYVTPSLAARNINASLALFAVCAQGAWIMLRRVDELIRPAARLTAFVFMAITASSLVRVYFDWQAPPEEDMFKSHLHDTLTVLAYQMLHVALTFSLYLVANRRLVGELELDIAERKRTERELSRLATTDPLSGLANRGQFMSRAAQELARTARYGGPLSVLMIDIDHFKVVNDTYGHQTGDHVLTALGRLLREALRDIDLAGRVGGEEFAVLLPQTGLAHAIEAAERLRGKVAAMQVPLERGVPLQITVSIGVACHSGDGVNLDTLLNQADTAMYEAKHAGRNRV
jgi:diguanylate cyclase (GGDEF)-like protein